MKSPDVPPTSASFLEKTLKDAFDRSFRAMQHAATIFEQKPFLAESTATAMSAATELRDAVGLFLRALPFIHDARTNALIRKNVASLLDDYARLRELSLPNDNVTSASRCSASSDLLTATSSAVVNGAVMRKRVAQELIDTEKTYCNNLATFVRTFVDPLKPKHTDPGAAEGGAVSDLTEMVLYAVGAAPVPLPNELLSTSEHELLFGAVEQMLPLNKMMLEQLEALLAAWDEKSRVGNVLFLFAPFFKIYSEAFVRQLQAPQLLQQLASERPGFSEFLEEASASADCGGQTIDSFLILPVQRVPRYRLFLEQLLLCTPTDHPDYARCNEALAQVWALYHPSHPLLFRDLICSSATGVQVSSVALELNETLRRFEQQQAMYKAAYRFDPPMLALVQPHRRLLLEGNLSKLRVNGHVMWVGFHNYNIARTSQRVFINLFQRDNNIRISRCCCVFTPWRETSADS